MGRYLCPTCSGGTRVIETRLSSERIRRRRACAQDHRFNTLEVPGTAVTELKDLVKWLGKHINPDHVDYANSEIDRILLGIVEEE